MADEITVDIRITSTDGITTETFGGENNRINYTVDQNHAALRRYTKIVRGLPLAKCSSTEEKYGFSIGDSIDMLAERQIEAEGGTPSATYKYNYLDFGEDIISPNVLLFYNMATDYPIWICTLFRTTDNGTYTVLPFLEIPPQKIIGPTFYPSLANNMCAKINETPMLFAMVGLPKAASLHATQTYRTLYTVVYDS